MTMYLLHMEYAYTPHSELLRRAEHERLVRAAQAGRRAGCSTSRVWWRPSVRFRRQLPQVVRPVAAL